MDLRLVGGWLALAVAVAVAHPFNQLQEGDDCRGDDGSQGTCRRYKNCPKAQLNWAARRIKTGICNSRERGVDTVVCCEPEFNTATRPGVKSRKMCEKYAEYTKYIVYSNIPGEAPAVREKCAVKSLISGGNEASQKEFPHMALILYEVRNTRKWWCGGTLISERFVLSAAHCTIQRQLSKKAKWVRLGEYNVLDNNEVGLARPRDYEIVQWINHPNYSFPSLYNDIALYKLASEVQFNDYVRPICLQTEHQFPNKKAIATGWGHIMASGGQPSKLLKVDLAITPKTDCTEKHKSSSIVYIPYGVDDESMFCAGDDAKNKEKDTCEGDSGGPLQVLFNNSSCIYSQVGVISFGSRCSALYPAVFTRVSHYIPWIESIVWP